MTVIGAASLNDDEFDTITIEVQAYSAELYAQIILILKARESVSTTINRLTYYFLARGVSVTQNPKGKSNIFLGSSLCK